MTTFITQARFTKDGLKGMVASPEDRAEVVGRLIGEVGGKLISYYMTSGDYDVLLIFEAHRMKTSCRPSSLRLRVAGLPI